MKTKLAIAIGVLFIIVIAAGVLIALPAPVHAPTTTTTTNSHITTQSFSSDNVIITSPLPGATVSKSFTVNGEARGAWYFEAQFPVQVRDQGNTKVGQASAHAQGDWTTDNFVPFTADVTVTGYSGPATLVLLKDNPSGLPENDDSVSIPIIVR